ncbi:MAG: hypothetical protein ACYDCN_16720 [Bacteroidia bacterium]
MKSKHLIYSFAFILFNSFCFASGDVPPLELLNFTVVPNINKIDIKFSTSIQTGGPYFTIEKSKDGKEFIKLVDIPAIEGGTTYSDYFETDYQPYSGVSFYRIKQTDEAGNYRYSQTVTLKIEEENVANTDEHTVNTISQISGIIYDISGSISEVPANNKTGTLLVLRDANGNDYYTMVQLNYKKNSLKSQEMFPSVSAGTYQVISSSNNELNNHKVIIK